MQQKTEGFVGEVIADGVVQKCVRKGLARGAARFRRYLAT